MSAVKANQVLNLDGDRIGSVVVDSIANMKNLNPEIEANATVELLGYYSKGDGGGGTFYWDSTSIEDDNGGTIIEATGVVDGRWIRNYSGAVNVKWFGALGDGATDDTTAIQNALNKSGCIYIPKGIYSVTSISYDGSVSIYGDGDKSVIIGEGAIFSITSCSNSSIGDFRMERYANPTTVVRDWGTWATSTLGTTGEGYMPGTNDTDGVWTSLTSAQQAETGVYINMVGAADNAGFYGKNISVRNISSKFGSIIIENSERVTISGCNLIGERASAGCIWIKNYQAIDNGASQAKDIVIDGNICQYASYNGITLDGTDGAIISNNITGYCGETGIKLWQDGASPAAISRGNFKTTVIGNKGNYNFEDGFNITSRYPNAATDNTYYTATGNYAYGNNSSGFTIDGKFNSISGNFSQGNLLDGYTLNISFSSFASNYAKDNNSSNEVSGRHEISIASGVNNAITSNFVYRTTTRNGNGIFVGNTETQSLTGNIVDADGAIVLGIQTDNAVIENWSGNFGTTGSVQSSSQYFDGVYLGGSTSANLLSDYEVGDWTPVVADASTGGNLATTATVDGKYVKIGQLVYVNFTLLNIDTTGLTAGNNVHIQGLPIPATGGHYDWLANGTAYLSDVVFGSYVIVRPSGASATSLELKNITTGAAAGSIIVSNLTTGAADITSSLCYYTDV